MCDSCEVLTINGVYCHELGCPEAWKDEIIYQYVQNDFFILNQYEPKDISFHNRLIAIQELTDLGLVKKRNCDGIAWEKITI